MPKKLILCLDGTNDQLGLNRPTNPAKVFEMLDLDDPARQIGYYDPGVGTLPSSTARGRIGRTLSVAGQLAFGYGLRTNVTQAYTWLMDNYRPEDKVYIFGFSRGAFTARALAAMLSSPGLLRSGSDNLVDYAVKEYGSRRSFGATATGPASPSDDQDRASEFADTLCWGTRRDPMNPEGSLSPGMALEGAQRVHAIPVEFMGVWDTVFAGLALSGWPGISVLPNVRRLRHAVSIDERRFPYQPVLVTPREGFEEAWFAGVHSDVGGTFPDSRLATVALKWVLGQVCTELDLRDGQPDAVFARYCTVEAPFATAPPHDNGPAWILLGTRARSIPRGALVHETVRLRRETDPGYRPELPDLDVRWADESWLDPPRFPPARIPSETDSALT